MDKFQSELLAQLKEHNRLTKELVKLHRAAINEPKKVSTEIFSAVKVRPAHWIINVINDDFEDQVCSHCGWTRTTLPGSEIWNYCPNCGMEMEKEGDSDA